MITFFVIATLVFALKLVLFAMRAAWGLTKAVFVVLGLPILLIVLFVAGLVYLAVPLLIIGLLVSFVLPGKRI